MTKNMISLTLFYGGLFLMLVCGGMALAGFKKEGSAAFAGWSCQYNRSLPQDIKALEEQSASYLQYKNWWDLRYRSMIFAAEKYGEGYLPYKLRSQMNAMNEQLHMMRIDYLALVHAVTIKHENSCGFKALKNAVNVLPQIESDFSTIREGIFMSYKIKSAPLNSQGHASFESKVRDILKAAQFYSQEGRS
jgi:hypothetical protein